MGASHQTQHLAEPFESDEYEYVHAHDYEYRTRRHLVTPDHLQI